MKILQLIKTSHGATWAWRQVRELIKLGHDVHVVLPGVGPMTGLYKKVGAEVHLLECDVGKLRSPISLSKQASRLRQLVCSLKPEIVHSHFVGTTLLMRLALRGLPVPRLFQVPGLLHLENGVTRRAEILAATHQDYWAASCKLTRQIYIDHGIAPERIGLAYYGTDFTGRSEEIGVDLRQELGVPIESPIVGMVAYAYAPKRWLGYKRGIKGHEDLIDSIAMIQDADVDAHGVFVGGAWNGADDYYRSIVDYGRCKLGKRAHFLGTRSDVRQIYLNFDVAVHPSHSENLGGAGESLAMAVPTIATDVGGFPDIVIEGETGWLVRPRDPLSLARAIQLAIGEPVHGKEMALKGQALVRDLLDVRSTSLQMAHIYRAIVDRCPLPC